MDGQSGSSGEQVMVSEILLGQANRKVAAKS